MDRRRMDKDRIQDTMKWRIMSDQPEATDMVRPLTLLNPDTQLIRNFNIVVNVCLVLVLPNYFMSLQPISFRSIPILVKFMTIFIAEIT